MKIIRWIIVAIMCASVAFTIFIGKDKIVEKTEYVERSEYKGVITLWQVDSFEGGTGSRKQFLLKKARAFERENKGVYVMVINHTAESVNEKVESGIFPDLISFGNGTRILELSEIDVKGVNGGKLMGKNYLTAWCRGGYVLISNPKISGEQIDKLIVSQQEYTQPLTALLLEGIGANEIISLKPMDAYVRFTMGKEKYLLGTQRDVVRLRNRGMEVETTALTKFNDLFQYVGVTSKEEVKKYYAEKFVQYLVSEKVQESLSEIDMFSCFYEVEYESKSLSKMQRINCEYTLSPFIANEQFKVIKELSGRAIKGEKELINKIKNMLD